MANDFDSTVPAGSTPINQVDDQLRLNNAQLVTTIGQEHEFIQGGNQYGRHKFPNGDAAAEALVTNMLAGTVFLRTDSANPGIDYYSGSAWAQIATLIPATTNMLFNQNAAPDGWTFDATANDRVLMVSSTEANGGTNHGTGTWTISGVTVDGHALTVAETPEHTHIIAGGVSASIGAIPHSYAMLAITSSSGTYTLPTSGNSPADTHTHGVTADGAWRPLARWLIACTKD